MWVSRERRLEVSNGWLLRRVMERNEIIFLGEVVIVFINWLREVEFMRVRCVRRLMGSSICGNGRWW